MTSNAPDGLPVGFERWCKNFTEDLNQKVAVRLHAGNPFPSMRDLCVAKGSGLTSSSKLCLAS